MKQLGIGFIMYTQDYDERFPSTACWAAQLYPYEKATGIYKCPDDVASQTSTSYPVSYAMNGNLGNQSGAAASSVSVTVLAAEFTTTGTNGNMTNPNDTGSASTTIGINGVNVVTVWGSLDALGTGTTNNPTIHDPALMFLAADGHVKLLRPEKVSGGAVASSSNGGMFANATSGTAAGTGGLSTTWTMTFSYI
jgi:hypothetical protein